MQGSQGGRAGEGDRECGSEGGADCSRGKGKRGGRVATVVGSGDDEVDLPRVEVV